MMVAAFAVTSNAQNVRWNPDGTKTLTQDGWTLVGIWGSDGLTKSKDFSSGYLDGSEPVWQINDNNSPSNAYMRMYKDPGGINSSRGLVMARIKYISGSTYPKGTFGYTCSSGHSVVVSVRNGLANIKSCQGDSTTYNNGDSISVPGGTTTYRVYALRYYASGTYDLWVSNSSSWSANSADWTQLISGGGWTSQSALVDHTGVARNGLVLGSFGPDSETWNGYIDYIAWSANTNEQLPWSFDPNPSVPDDSQYISDTIPSTMTPGQSYSVSITLKNTGTNTWTSAALYKLGAVGDSDPFCAFTRVDLAPGDKIFQYAPGPDLCKIEADGNGYKHIDNDNAPIQP